MKKRYEIILYMDNEPTRHILITTRANAVDARKVASRICNGAAWRLLGLNSWAVKFSFGTLCCVIRKRLERDAGDSVQFWLQTRTWSGDWVDSLGSNDIFSCIEHGKWFVKERHHDADDVRVVERLNIPKWTNEKIV